MEEGGRHVTLPEYILGRQLLKQLFLVLLGVDVSWEGFNDLHGFAEAELAIGLLKNAFEKVQRVYKVVRFGGYRYSQLIKVDGPPEALPYILFVSALLLLLLLYDP